MEEIGEASYRLDRTLQQLQDAGILAQVTGIGIGELRSCLVPPGADWALEDLLRSHLEPLGVPVVVDLPFGHGPANHAWLHGGSGHLAEGSLRWDGGLA